MDLVEKVNDQDINLRNESCESYHANPHKPFSSYAPVISGAMGGAIIGNNFGPGGAAIGGLVGGCVGYQARKSIPA